MSDPTTPRSSHWGSYLATLPADLRGLMEDLEAGRITPDEYRAELAAREQRLSREADVKRLVAEQRRKPGTGYFTF